MPELGENKTPRERGTLGQLNPMALSLQRSMASKSGVGGSLTNESLSIQDIGKEVLGSMKKRGAVVGELLTYKVSDTIWARGGFAKYKDWPAIVPGSAVKNAPSRDETRMKDAAAKGLDLLWERIEAQGGKPLLYREHNAFGRVFGEGVEKPWEPAFLHRGKIYIRCNRLCMFVGSASRMKNSLVWAFRKP